MHAAAAHYLAPPDARRTTPRQILLREERQREAGP